jgi:hypothetical protein
MDSRVPLQSGRRQNYLEEKVWGKKKSCRLPHRIFDLIAFEVNYLTAFLALSTTAPAAVAAPAAASLVASTAPAALLATESAAPATVAVAVLAASVAASVVASTAVAAPSVAVSAAFSASPQLANTPKAIANKLTFNTFFIFLKF